MAEYQFAYTESMTLSMVFSMETIFIQSEMFRNNQYFRMKM